MRLYLREGGYLFRGYLNFKNVIFLELFSYIGSKLRSPRTAVKGSETAFPNKNKPWFSPCACRSTCGCLTGTSHASHILTLSIVLLEMVSVFMRKMVKLLDLHQASSFTSATDALGILEPVVLCQFSICKILVAYLAGLL